MRGREWWGKGREGEKPIGIVKDGVILSIESHFVGVHGPYELHRKEKQIEWTASIGFFVYFWNGHRERRSSHDIYNFIRAKQNDRDGAVLIYIAMQTRSYEYTPASNTFVRENTGQV